MEKEDFEYFEGLNVRIELENKFFLYGSLFIHYLSFNLSSSSSIFFFNCVTRS